MNGPPGNGKGAVQAPIPKHTNLPQSNSERSIAQVWERDRALQLAWLCARELVGTKGTLAEITELLSDIRTLAQQEVDLLRRLLSRDHTP